MNEKIKELLEQVGGYGTQALVHPDDLEKFAKLIVRECLTIVENQIPDSINKRESSSDFIAGWEVNREVTIEEIMIQFGIEENHE